MVLIKVQKNYVIEHDQSTILQLSNDILSYVHVVQKCLFQMGIPLIKLWSKQYHFHT